MIIKNKELKGLLEKYGRQYTLTMYANRFIHMTEKQLDHVLRYGEKNDKKRKTR